MGPRATLQESGRGTTNGRAQQRWRATLVVTEVALAVVLTISAGLLLRSFATVLAVHPGFAPDHLLTWQMNLPQRLRTPDDRLGFYRELFDRLQSLPGVVAVGGTTRLPLGSTSVTTTANRKLPTQLTAPRRGSAAMVSSPQSAIARNIITTRMSKLRRSSHSLPTRIKKQAVVAIKSVYPARPTMRAKVRDIDPPAPNDILRPTNTRSALKM